MCMCMHAVCVCVRCVCAWMGGCMDVRKMCACMKVHVRRIMCADSQKVVDVGFMYVGVKWY